MNLSICEDCGKTIFGKPVKTKEGIFCNDCVKEEVKPFDLIMAQNDFIFNSIKHV